MLLSTIRPSVVIGVCILKAFLTTAVRCYCTEDHCYPYGYCEADWCLVGIRRSTNEVIRTCGTDEAARLHRLCRRGVGDWTELCACAAGFCNTFAYLREQIASGRFIQHSSRSQTQRKTAPAKSDDVVVFGRVDPPSGRRTKDRPRHMSEDNGDALANTYQDKPINSNRTRFLTILLVVVPLVVGGAAVIIVTANYYCHLC